MKERMERGEEEGEGGRVKGNKEGSGETRKK